MGPGRRPGSLANARTLRHTFRPFRPELDRFLFAQVGDEVDGRPLSVISALTCLGVDPWEEASRLSSFSDREAAEQLARLIADLPNDAGHPRDAGAIAVGLVALLPERGLSLTRAPQIQIRPRFWPTFFPKQSQFWIACFVIAGAALITAAMHSGFSFWIWSP